MRFPGGCKLARDVGKGMSVAGLCGSRLGDGPVGNRPAGGAGALGNMERVAAATDAALLDAVGGCCGGGGGPAMTPGGGPDGTRLLLAAIAAAIRATPCCSCCWVTGCWGSCSGGACCRIGECGSLGCGLAVSADTGGRADCRTGDWGRETGGRWWWRGGGGGWWWWCGWGWWGTWIILNLVSPGPSGGGWCCTMCC